MNKIARRMKWKEMAKKRFLSVVLILALVATMVSVAPPDNSVKVAQAATTPSKDGALFRGVVDEITELPQYINADNLAQPRGTADHPFVVLEIVPYEQYGEFGYLVSGCEPVKVEEMYGRHDMALVASIAGDSVHVNGKTAWFFLDEPMADKAMFDYFNTNPGDQGKTLNGYYEVVAEGEGTLRYEIKPINQPSVSGGDMYPGVSGGDMYPGVSDGDMYPGVSDGDMYPGVSDGDIHPDPSFGNVTSETNPDFDSSGNSVSHEAIEEKTEVSEETEIPEETKTFEGAETPEITETLEVVETSEITETPVVTEIPEVIETPEENEASEVAETPGTIVTPVVSTVYPAANNASSLIATLAPNALSDAKWEITIEPADGKNGNLIWHTINFYEEDEFADITRVEASSVEGNTVIINTNEELVNLGDRLYTSRYAEIGEFAEVTYYQYIHDDAFLRVSLGLTQEEADNYSIVVKTITPDMLNKTPEWVDYADLIYISPKYHVGATIDLWTNPAYRRLERTDNTKYTSTDKLFDKNDIDWDTALRIYYKTTADKNYAAIILDDNFFNNVSTQNINITIHNWNLEPAYNMYGQPATYNANGSNINVYKLYVMLMCMDPYLFKQLYLNENNPLIQKNEKGEGEFLLQRGNAATYWCTETFMLFPDYLDYSSYNNDYQYYWDSDEMWEAYQYGVTKTTTTKKNWCNDHLYTFNGSNLLSQDFATGTVGKDDAEYWSMFEDFYNSLSEEEKGNAHPTEAIRYILGEQKNSSAYGDGLTVKILDLEPSVGLNSDYTYDWYLRESYVRMLLPHFRGNIQISHQTTAEFIGKIEDLNSTYQMIYLGLDYSAYNTSEQTLPLVREWVETEWGGYWSESQYIKKEWPDWNDNSLDGKIYLHTGDLMTSAVDINGNLVRSANWLWNTSGTGENLRFPGNDISSINADELIDFVKAGYVVAAETCLYKLSNTLIDPKSNIYGFVRDAKNTGLPIFDVANSVSIDAKMREVYQQSKSTAVTFDKTPAAYNGVPTMEKNAMGEDEAHVLNPNYLPVNASGRRYLEFEFTTIGDGYLYRLYVDQDKDSKFADGSDPNEPSEILVSGYANNGYNYLNYPLNSSMVGVIHWKLEVYKEENPSIRYVKSGFSAAPLPVDASGKTEKKKVHVLQIMPNSTAYNNLSTDDTFIKYYSGLADFDITIESITWEDYKGCFPASDRFSYDYTKEIDTSNPKNLDKIMIVNVDGKQIDLSTYDMFIVGFGDAYGGVNLSNANGEVDYIRYFLDQGKSILFTHDLSSFYNTNPNAFGSTVNTLLRDVMGMNRYRSISSLNIYSDNSRNVEERNRLAAYQSAHADDYDWIDANEVHGYTYYAMKRMGYKRYASGSSGKMPYTYMIINPEGKVVNSYGPSSGFNNGGDVTTLASMVNEGQVTSYPYLIDPSLLVADTHAQYYQLSPEDDDVTVWYTLEGDQNVTRANAADNVGSSITYAVSPSDTMNNYYIYSKGNIFYSGVGHTEVTSDMEAMLFVNTMIAAFKAPNEPPVIEVMNEEAVLTGSRRYSIEMMQDYDDFVDGLLSSSEVSYSDEDTYKVYFRPVDYNVTTTEIKCKIQLEDGDYFSKIWKVKSDGSLVKIEENSEHMFTGMENYQLYCLEYPKKYLNSQSGQPALRTIVFTVYNDLVKGYGNNTYLNFSIQPLFPLD